MQKTKCFQIDSNDQCTQFLSMCQLDVTVFYRAMRGFSKNKGKYMKMNYKLSSDESYTSNFLRESAQCLTTTLSDMSCLKVLRSSCLASDTIAFILSPFLPRTRILGEIP